MNICTLKPVLDVSPLQTLIDTVAMFPSFVHVYGQPQPEKVPKWMMYGDAKRDVNTPDKIEFLRGYYESAPEEFKFMNDFFKDSLKIEKSHPQWINLMRTRGFISRHTDEVRLSCVNIGLRNTTSGVTGFDGGEIRCEDGRAYLLDVSKPHWVTGSPDFRYLISFSFIVPYEKMRAHFASFDLIEKED